MWLNSRGFQVGYLIFQEVLPLLVVFCFSRARSIRQFLNEVGAAKRLTRVGWYASWIAIALGLLGVYAVTQRLAPMDYAYRRFSYNGDWSRWFFIVYGVVLVPFCEETVMRGFLYPAFRRGYGKGVSTLLVLGVGTVFHWSRMSDSLPAFMCIGLLMLLLCVVREQTGSLWDCILGHAVYNATGLMSWPFYVIPVVLLWPLVGIRKKEL